VKYVRTISAVENRYDSELWLLSSRYPLFFCPLLFIHAQRCRGL